MNINLFFRPRFSLKKIILFLLILFCLLFLKEDVFASTDYDSLRESYNNYIINSFTNKHGTSDVVSNMEQTKPITDYSFRNLIDNLESSFPYYLQYNEYTYSQYDSTQEPTVNYRLILFPDVPYIEELTSGYSGYYSNNNLSGYIRKTSQHFVGYNSSQYYHCYMFDFIEDDLTSYGRVNVYYSDRCFISSYNNVTDRVNDEMSFLPTYGGFYDTSKVYSRVYKDYIYVANNFSLVNQTTGETTPASNINHDITVPEETLTVEHTSLLNRIINGIVSIPSIIINGIVNLFSSLFDFIHDFFIPSSQAFSDFLNDEYNYCRQQLGFLFYPIELLTNFINRFMNIPDTQTATFNIPEVSFLGTVVIHSTTFDLSSLVSNNNMLGYLYSLYRIVISGLIVLWVCKLGYKKFNETIGGSYK